MLSGRSPVWFSAVLKGTCRCSHQRQDEGTVLLTRRKCTLLFFAGPQEVMIHLNSWLRAWTVDVVWDVRELSRSEQ